MTYTIINPMTETEARDHVQAINGNAMDMGRRLIELRDREGWRVLGYRTWTECLEGEFAYSRKHLYELMNAAPILERMLPTGNKIGVGAAAALSKFDEELQPLIIRAVNARYDSITESNIQRVGAVVTQLANTGHVETAPGKSTPLDAALDEEDHQAELRRKQYQRSNGERITIEVALDADGMLHYYVGSEHRRKLVKVIVILPNDE